MKLYPIRQPVEAWQFGSGIPPEWVDRCTKSICGDLFHNRKSGLQLLNAGEWLVRNLDGEVLFYTDKELWRVYEKV